ncbi:Bromodomain containing protein [Trichomonas vaginalis G3]|uniref:Bromodomain containing protein n=1 Tax=Trichomonas vaginalis (strain ATCC PRA-98 / G3) TaxID=412133 RepID=A2FGR1_TRIV3|nr:acetylation-dependent protein binding [Trichomonas vaginalis G3]EAX95897.1 Bromodomain containing protein [Trichomonas vaginalis G3]KAI5551221.1 acetylation-dependent protein binding [Trichomonas vaginalis G3]|eukprot:XP_001308827.1 Bromodomain containing protein [Trichomonas vaginalis G3]
MSEKLSDYDKSWISRVLVDLFKWPLTQQFRQPVDPVRDGVENYFDIIKNPVDLSTMKKKLNEGTYKTIQQFTDDIHLMYENSLQYNGNSSYFTYIAADIEKWYLNRLKLKGNNAEEEWKNRVFEIIEKLNEHRKLNPAERMPLSAVADHE